MINTITRTFEILDNDKVNRIDCKIYYILGGYNPWRSSNESRGYWFSIHEWTLEEHDNYLIRHETLSVCGSNGIKCLVEPVTRQSKKRYEIAKGKFDELIERFLQPYCDEHGYKLGRLLEETEE